MKWFFTLIENKTAEIFWEIGVWNTRRVLAFCVAMHESWSVFAHDQNITFTFDYINPFVWSFFLNCLWMCLIMDVTIGIYWRVINIPLRKNILLIFECFIVYLKIKKSKILTSSKMNQIFLFISQIVIFYFIDFHWSNSIRKKKGIINQFINEMINPPALIVMDFALHSNSLTKKWILLRFLIFYIEEFIYTLIVYLNFGEGRWQ